MHTLIICTPGGYEIVHLADYDDAQRRFDRTCATSGASVAAWYDPTGHQVNAFANPAQFKHLGK